MCLSHGVVRWVERTYRRAAYFIPLFRQLWLRVAVYDTNVIVTLYLALTLSQSG